MGPYNQINELCEYAYKWIQCTGEETYGPTLFVAAQLIHCVRYANIDLLGIGKEEEKREILAATRDHYASGLN